MEKNDSTLPYEQRTCSEIIKNLSSGNTTQKRQSAAPTPTQSLLSLSAHLDTLHAHELLTSQVLDLILFFIQNSLQKPHILSRLKETQTQLMDTQALLSQALPAAPATAAPVFSRHCRLFVELLGSRGKPIPCSSTTPGQAQPQDWVLPVMKNKSLKKIVCKTILL